MDQRDQSCSSWPSMRLRIESQYLDHCRDTRCGFAKSERMAIASAIRPMIFLFVLAALMLRAGFAAARIRWRPFGR